MFGENKFDDMLRFGKAFATNQIARFAPHYYVRLTEQTGRGGGAERPEKVAQYFFSCFNDYFNILGISQNLVADFLKNKTILEYGPGDTPGVALLMYAYGADKIFCVDRFPLVSFSEFNIEIFDSLLNLLEGEPKRRAQSCFKEVGNPSSGLKNDAIEYLVKSDGLSGLHNEVDLVISRAVLEHVNNLPATIGDMERALVNGGLSVHQVDLKSHGLHKRNQLDFLTWPEVLWNLMYSQKGVPNRLRVNAYKTVTSHSGLKLKLLEPTLLAEQSEIAEVAPYLAAPFKNIRSEDLSWLGFWIILSKP